MVGGNLLLPSMHTIKQTTQANGDAQRKEKKRKGDIRVLDCSLKKEAGRQVEVERRRRQRRKKNGRKKREERWRGKLPERKTGPVKGAFNELLFFVYAKAHEKGVTQSTTPLLHSHLRWSKETEREAGRERGTEERKSRRPSVCCLFNYTSTMPHGKKMDEQVG
mmetsp:Transcript_25696/g.50298  ORF Transcript_25696/g.50298 Transcript_25696/m.50298 type:complete len:164 (-) Transcript_25696:239-730(-)